MAASDLERQLGELAGKLGAAVPLLERTEEKADANALELARLAQEVSQSRQATERDVRGIELRLDRGAKDFEELRLVQDRHKQTLERIEPVMASVVTKRELEALATKAEVDTLRTAVSDIRTGKKEWRGWWWTLIQLTVSGLIGAVVTAILMKALKLL